MILARSPYYAITQDFGAVNQTAKIYLKIWRGHKVNDEPTEETRIFTLVKPAPNITKLSKDISPHIRDFFLSETIQPFTTTTNSQDSAVWVKYEIEYLEDPNIQNDVVVDFAVEGYSNYLDGVNYQADGLLQNYIQNRKIKKVWNKGVTIIGFSYDVNINVNTYDENGTLTSLNVFPLSEFSHELISYVVLDNSGYGEKISVEITDEIGNVLDLFYYDVVCENKFEPKNIVFKNKYGAYENIYFFKKSTESVNIENKEFVSNVITADASYDKTKHQFRNFATNSKKTINLTTGFVDEALNQNLEQLMHSNAIWLQDEKTLYPVNIKTTSKEFKSERVDQKISYNFEFEYAFNNLNTM